MKWILNVPTLLAAALALGCSRGSPRPPTAKWQPPPNAYPYDQVITALAYPYHMGAAEREAFIAKLQALRPGDSYEAVVKLLGPPYIQQIHAPKESEEVTRTSLSYYLTKATDGFSQADRCVYLDFDVHNRLTGLNLQSAPDVSRLLTKMPGTDSSWDDAKKETVIVERRVAR